MKGIANNLISIVLHSLYREKDSKIEDCNNSIFTWAMRPNSLTLRLKYELHSVEFMFHARQFEFADKGWMRFFDVKSNTTDWIV